VPVSEPALIEELKELILEMLSDERVITREQLPEARARLDAQLLPETPLAELGWDSMQFPALLVRAEDRWGIDTSEVSVFDVFTVQDLVRALSVRIEARR
jgi:acyl carrier protein